MINGGELHMFAVLSAPDLHIISGTPVNAQRDDRSAQQLAGTVQDASRGTDLWPKRLGRLLVEAIGRTLRIGVLVAHDQEFVGLEVF